MSGNPENASVWTEGLVWIADSLLTVDPADSAVAMPLGWNLVGILDGGEGFTSAAGFTDIKKLYGWGSKGPVAITRKYWEETKKFTALEDNPVTRGLLYPGSAAGVISIPVIQNIKMCFELIMGGKSKRWITKNFAQVDIDGDIKENEDDLTALPFIANIFPEANGDRWVELKHPDVVSLAITPLTLALSLAGANVKPLTATATYSDATTSVVSSEATWTSAAAAKATVDGRYVTGVATGTSNVSCTYGGITSTAPSAVTVSA